MIKVVQAEAVRTDENDELRDDFDCNAVELPCVSGNLVSAFREHFAAAADLNSGDVRPTSGRRVTREGLAPPVPYMGSDRRSSARLAQR